MASGRVTRADGKPIGIDGVKYQLRVAGNTAAGQAVAYAPQVAADGTWSVKLAPGVYHPPTCSVSVPFNGTAFNYDLVPSNDAGDVDATAGVTADFVWNAAGSNPRFRGAKPADPTRPTDWWGACCSIRWRGSYPGPGGQNVVLPPPAAGATCVFTAKPVGARIDGLPPAPLVWRRAVAKDDFVVTALNDIPPTSGGWDLTGLLAEPGKPDRPVTFQVGVSDAFEPAQHLDVKPAWTLSNYPCDLLQAVVVGPHD